MSSEPQTPSRPTRDLRDLKDSRRSAAQSLWRTHAEQRQSSNFLTGQLIPWITHYLATALLPRRPFAAFPADAPVPHGLVTLPARSLIGLAADWGTGSANAYRVGDLIASRAPDFTVHLGDVYYSGTSEEYEKYFLAPNAWPMGKTRTFALNANHEMYSGGEGYFERVLPSLKQPTSYFCLQNDYWRILGLDTGYFARTFPLLELFLVSLIRLHTAIQSWLKEVVFADENDRRPVVVLSHHQWYSSYDTEYHRVGSNLSPYLDRVSLWIWGHEHRFAVYGPFGFEGKTVRSRCIGHGGMPVELTGALKRQRPLLLEDRRQAATLGTVPIGFCGFALLRFDGPELTIEYRDENDLLVFAETWTSNKMGATGRKTLVLQDPKVHVDTRADPDFWGS